MIIGVQQITLVVLAACAIVTWLRSGRGQVPKTTRARLVELGWCVALMAISVNVMPAVGGQAATGVQPEWTIAAPLAAGALVLAVPRLAPRLVAIALIVLGLYGFMVARDFGFWGPPVSYGLVHGGGDSMGYYLVLPEAYAFLGLGGWLGWRTLDRESARVRRLLGMLATPSGQRELWGLLLLPVVFSAAALISPNVWLAGSLLGYVGTAAVLAGAVTLIRRAPVTAAAVATVGLICLGLAGLYVAKSWGIAGGGPTSLGAGHLPVTQNDFNLYGMVTIASRSTAYVAIAQGLALIAFGAWLTPRTIPSAPRLLGWASDAELTRRVQRLTETRAVAVDTAAADLRRLERDLHDGAQARLVALGMSLRAVERLIPVSPDAAIALVAEARETSARALTELRELVRGVHPPVLADRGLGDAIRALALDAPLKVETDIDLPGRLAAPIETACYFAVAEILTNAVKHSGARDARICVAHADGMLRIAVTDFGMGGADPALGSGLAGVEKRLATFDGIVAVSSPPGGPTMIVVEVPCASSSQKISSC
jgi:signal transduction histidine kinase